jgi:hypothetical protein
MSDRFSPRGSPVLIGEPKKQRALLMCPTDHLDIQLITLVAVRQGEIGPGTPESHAEQKQQHNLHPDPTFAQHEFTLKNCYLLFIALSHQSLNAFHIQALKPDKIQTTDHPQVDYNGPLIAQTE